MMGMTPRYRSLEERVASGEVVKFTVPFDSAVPAVGNGDGAQVTPPPCTLDDIIDATEAMLKQADLKPGESLLLVSIEVHVRTVDPAAFVRAYAASNGCKLCGAAFDCGTCASAAKACHACGVGKCGMK